MLVQPQPEVSQLFQAHDELPPESQTTFPGQTAIEARNEQQAHIPEARKARSFEGRTPARRRFLYAKDSTGTVHPSGSDLFFRFDRAGLGAGAAPFLLHARRRRGYS